VIILALETSCDETAAAIVEETGDAARPWRALSNVVASQIDLHREWGGVVPELSARQHVRDICGVVDRALTEAGRPRFDAVAVTRGPGLVGSLLVGLSFAKSLAWAHQVPLVPVHHLAGHIESVVIDNGEMPLPAIVLVVSGGHTSLYRVPEPGVYQLLGRTRDDAAGEAYDKVAKLLGLGYPGGPVIDRLAAEGNDRAVNFPKTRLTHADRNAPHLPGRQDFSFSGLKTSVLRHVTSRRTALGVSQDAPLPDAEVRDIAASFQRRRRARFRPDRRARFSDRDCLSRPLRPPAPERIQ
jgi:N6-L-threonylcarbamoyladenine synthase